MESGNGVLTTKRVLIAILYFLVYPAVIMLLSGDLFWVEGWIFGIWYFAMSLTTTVYLYGKDLWLLSERYKKPGSEGHKKWDVYVTYAYRWGFRVWLVIMPLDAKRFGWTVYSPTWAKFLGGALLVISFFFLCRAYTDNTFLSPLVRIQSERNHYVVSTGVYGFVRHPMYLGLTLQLIGAPMFVGSNYGIIAGILMSLLLAGRIIGEEKMLVNELEGYKEYREKVKYRLIPFIW